MDNFKFKYDWIDAGTDEPKYRQTMALLELHIGNVNLLKNHDIWSKTIHEFVLVSAYPLAVWLASSWWRLNWEPLPAIYPSMDWRMAHELGAANHGFVWPQIVFASDREVMQAWAMPLNGNDNQSVRYLNGLEIPASIPLTDFRSGVENFIIAVLDRLTAMDCRNTELSNLWQFIQEERSDPNDAKYRRFEAEMGYDPDECPEELMHKALELDQKMGTAALSELAPVYGKSATQTPLTAIEEIAGSDGLVGLPNVPRPVCDASVLQGAPWRRAVAVARALRKTLGNTRDKIDNDKLCELLGLDALRIEQWSPPKRNDVAIAVPESGNHYKFIPRKEHPTGKRFELARFLGDYLLIGQTNGDWLASTNLSTSRQKFQRAFAAEFLCPIAALRELLEDDYSEFAIEDATKHFQVSQRTVETLLVNYGLVSRTLVDDYAEPRLPYQLGI